MFHALYYNNAWHHPLICFVGVACLLLALARRLPFLSAYLVVFAAEISLDALCTGAWSPVPKDIHRTVAISFVVLGDWRYLLLFERYSRGRPDGGAPARAWYWLSSVALAFVVPLLQAAVIKLAPGWFTDSRRVYLVYELMFACLATVLLTRVIPRRMRDHDPRITRFVRGVTRFFIVQYLLWASADILFLLGNEWALALRLVPNTLYYAGFLLFVWWTAPDAPARRGGPALALGGLLVAFALAFTGLARKPEVTATQGAALRFQVDGQPVARVSLAALREQAPSETWTAFDPYYNREKTWHALPLADVLAVGFEGALAPGDAREQVIAALREREFMLRATDGYTVHMPGRELLQDGSYLAYADAETPAWEPVGPQRAHPGPFYLVWRHEHQQELATHPRPWALAEIDAVAFERAFPHTVPTGASNDAPAARGFQSFRARCLRCHAINREGGRVGPELNVPQNILEYRPVDQVKQYIRDPSTFRHSAMPPHPELDDAALDELIAYFAAMGQRKREVAEGDAH